MVVQRADHPSDIIWYNQGYNMKEQMWRQMTGYIIQFSILSGDFIGILILSRMSVIDETDEELADLYASLNPLITGT